MQREIQLARSPEVEAYRHARTPADLAACYPVLLALRPQLGSPSDWIRRAEGLALEGYHLLLAWRENEVIAAAGYRIMTNLIHGRFLYVDDLITVPNKRGGGVGAALLDQLLKIGLGERCERLVLDTGVDNTSAQRFYRREGLSQFSIGFLRKVA